MDNQLRIQILGTLDISSSRVEINKRISELQKQISELSIKLNIDDKTLNTLSNLSKMTDNFNKVVKEEVEILKRADGSIEKLTRQYKANGEIFERTTKNLNEKSKATQNDTQTINNQTKAIQQQGKVLQETITLNEKNQQISKKVTTSNNGVTNTYKYNGNDQLANITLNTNYSKQVSEINRLEKAMLTLFNQGKITEAKFQRFNTLLNNARNISEIDKLDSKVKKLDSTFTKMKQTAENTNLQNKLLSDANSLLTMNPRNLDKTQLNQLVTSIKQIQPTAKNASNSLRQLETQLKSVQSASKDAAGQSMGLVDSFNTAMVKYPVWLAATSVFIGIPRLVRNAIDTIVELDTKLVSLQKVMNEDTNFENMMNSAIESAREFGKTLTDTMDSYTEFARQGYTQEEVPVLADAALVASNVGEISAGQAAEYLTSALIQMKLEAKDAMSVIDAWNNISNKNATTVEKLAQGYAKSASVARVWKMDMHELNAVIGTVTAATKQSGNEVG